MSPPPAPAVLEAGGPVLAGLSGHQARGGVDGRGGDLPRLVRLRRRPQKAGAKVPQEAAATNGSCQVAGALWGPSHPPVNSDSTT